MRATVITDASFCQQQYVGGWAAWVALDGGQKIQMAGPFKHQCPNNAAQAELMASINGLWIARYHGAIEILLQTDCEAVLHVIGGRSKSEKLNSIWEDSKELLGLAGVTINLRHVKGHTSIQDARSYVNRWCDQEARKHMKAMRNTPKAERRRKWA